MKSKDLKNIVGAINGVARFEGEYMMRMMLNGFVEKADEEHWRLTRQGKEKLKTLGPAAKPQAKALRAGEGWKDRPDYDPKSDLYNYVRKGSDDAMKLPSRIGDRLFYRDGTVKEI
jgi:hypothetical protein